ncbi:MAG: cupin domain-containing protein [Candidatus Izemoplasmatales bacterium]
MLLKDKLYQMIGYMLFILVPFFAGLVIVFRDMNSSHVEVYTVVIDVAVLWVFSMILAFGNGKWLPAVSRLDLKYLLFGLIGNMIIYFYTFQNALEIRQFVTIYLVILLILFSKYLLFDRIFKHKELWVSMIVFFVVDFINLLFHCGFYEGSCVLNRTSEIILFMINLLMFIYLFGSFIYQIYKYKHFTVLKIIHFTLFIILVQFFLRLPNGDLSNKFYLTVMILVPFLIVCDYIYHFVTKQYYRELTFFYIRTLTLLFIAFFLGEQDFFSVDPDGTVLSMMVVATYVIFFIHLFPERKEEVTKEMILEKVNVAQKLTQFDDLWTPKIIGELNQSYVKIAKIEGEFIWHKHDKEDELFYCLEGEVILELKEQKIILKKGEMFIVPKGVLHKPSSVGVSSIMMIELKTTKNTGNIQNELTKTALEKI